MSNKVYLTNEGFLEIEEELNHLKEVKRPEIIKALKDARALGDLSENADYDAARNEQAQIEGRILELEKILETAELIEKKDYIKNPKSNGYRSLHIIVGIPIFLAHEKRIMKVEIQLRTIAMDFWASLEHQLYYKKSTTFTEEMAKELLTCAELSAELDNKMDSLRKRVLSDKN